MRIIGVLEGKVLVTDATNPVELSAGQFCLVPASVKSVEIRAEPDTRFLLTEPGE
jgi:mannose-6-phosphate isomerase-like protein (cupin superfamily)